MAFARTGKGSVACIYFSVEKVSEWMEDIVMLCQLCCWLRAWLVVLHDFDVSGCWQIKLLLFQDAGR